MNTNESEQKTTLSSQSLILNLTEPTSPAWVEVVLSDFDSFLIDHAACERKASGMALSMCTHYPDQPDLVRAMSDLAIEELVHYRDVLKWMAQRGLKQLPDEKDPYIGALQKLTGRGKSAYLRDRLLLAAIIEKRGHERFDLVAQALEQGPLQQFYDRIAQSEARHYELFLQLAQTLCQNSDRTLDAKPNDSRASNTLLQQRLNELVEAEGDIIRSLPLRAKLH